jgi:hypothetical protein
VFRVRCGLFFLDITKKKFVLHLGRTYAIFNDAVSGSDCVPWNDSIISG